MRCLQRNRRALWYAKRIGAEPVVDEYGNETLEERTVYGAPVSVEANVSANAGAAAAEVFGTQTAYSRTVCFAAGACPLDEEDVVWFGKEPNAAGDDYNYVVVRVADSKNSVLVALREVTARE